MRDGKPDVRLDGRGTDVIFWIVQVVVVEKEEKVGFGDGKYDGSGDGW